MTRSKPRLSLTIPLQIPTWWTPEQALAVFEMIDDLRSAVWKCYQVQLLNEYRDLLKEAAAMQLGTPGTGPRRSSLLNFKNIFRRRGVPRWYPSHSLDVQIEACPS
jgi:hypothetical protein